MSGDPLYVQTDGLRSFSQTHSEVVAGLSQLMGAAAPAAAGVETTHGPIAAAVSAALSDLLGARQSTLQTTANSGNTLSELLQRAAQAYEDGDKRGASAMVSAAEAMANADGAGGAAVAAGGAAGAGAGAANAAAPGGGGAGDAMGQVISQMGQQAGQLGQMAQSVAQPLQGLAQPLQQLPQQVMQGAQHFVEKATQAADKAQPKGADAGAPEQRDETPPGVTAGTGRAPDQPPVHRAEPAQTRPQSD
ncbi:MAG: hypothetical protein JWR37_528 [Mycobacterium sp.]|nr:hypothetical protein [Mycobacterium sp.]